MPARVRIQSWRKPGGKKPDGVVIVARPSKWGNPFSIGKTLCHGGAGAFRQDAIETNQDAVDAFTGMVMQHPRNYPATDEIIDQLRGKDLACYCPLDAPCHADVLLKIANDKAP